MAQMKKTKGSAVHPAVRSQLSQLGSDIALARRLRRLSAQDMADRMGVDRSTLRRVEKGDPGVSLNTLAMALVALGLLDRLGKLVDRAEDDIGLLVGGAHVPKQMFRPRRTSPQPVAGAGAASSGSSSSGASQSGTSQSVASSDADEPEGW